MNPIERNATPTQALDLAIASDVDALRAVTAQDLPDLRDTSAWLANTGSTLPAPRTLTMRWRTLAVAAAMTLLLAALAMAIVRVLELRLRLDGRSNTEIERDVRRQLEAGGVNGATVHVDRDSGTTNLVVRAPKDASVPTDVRVSIDGRDTSSTKTLRYSPDPGKSDSEIAADLERLLHERGFDAHVVVRDGHVVSIQRRP